MPFTEGQGPRLFFGSEPMISLLFISSFLLLWISRGANPSKTKESPKGSLGQNKVGPSKQSKRCVCCFPRRMQGVIRMPMSEKPADAKSCTTSSKSSETAESHQGEEVLMLFCPPCFSCFILSLRRSRWPFRMPARLSSSFTSLSV